VENRLFKQAAKLEEELEEKRIAQEFSFTPNIYKSKRSSRWGSTTGRNKDLREETKGDIPPLPPRDNNLSKIKLKYKEQELLASKEAKAEKKKIKFFSPVLEWKNKGYHSARVNLE